MYRIRIKLPGRQVAFFKHQDLLHDALVNAWMDAGADAQAVIGMQARPWTFAALGGRRNDRTGRVHTLVVSTPDTELAAHLKKFDSSAVRYARASTEEILDFAPAEIITEPDPVPPGEGILSCLLLSPFVVSTGKGSNKRWHRNLAELDLSAIVNKQLSRLTDRPVKLQIQADTLYLRANPNHSVLVSLKRLNGGHHAFVIGMQAPLVLAGKEDDLRLAWYAGIGEKRRNGFGCLGLLERGIGR